MHRIQLSNTEFEGENNAYLLGTDSGPVTLIDTGVATESVRRDLEQQLATVGYSFDDIEQILLTHWHPDHAGLAGHIQQRSDATVYIHQADAGLVDGHEISDFRRLRRTRFREWGIPREKREELIDFLDRHSDRAGIPPSVTSISPGETFAIDDRLFETVHLPGHTAGLVAYFDRDRNVAFSGDVILPKYTPNIGGADVRVTDPLSSYLESLKKLVAADLDRVLPGHRYEIQDPTDRALTIIGHHRERTERVYSVVDRHGPMDPWAVSAELFGSLERIHIMHGPGEAAAHLEHLTHEGVLECDGRMYDIDASGKERYHDVLEKMFKLGD